MRRRNPEPVVLLVLAAAFTTLMAACSSEEGTSSTNGSPNTTTGATTTTPAVIATTPVVSGSEIARWRIDAEEFSAAYHGSWPDIDAALERFAEDFVFYDPADGDFIIEGSNVMVPTIRTFAGYYSQVEWTLDEIFLSADGAAYRLLTSHGYWPPWGGVEPADHQPVAELDVFRFEGDAVTSFDIWFENDSLELMGFGCFTVEGCPELVNMVERYVAAWASGDREQIASLYADDATFTDTLLGLHAVGPEAIARTSAARFGQGNPTIEVVELYAQTSGPVPPTDADPDRGELIAIGLHYRVPSPNGDTASFESLTTFEFGTRHTSGFTRHPQGLITREEVFHNPDALTQIGQ